MDTTTNPADIPTTIVAQRLTPVEWRVLVALRECGDNCTSSQVRRQARLRRPVADVEWIILDLMQHYGLVRSDGYPWKLTARGKFLAVRHIRQTEKVAS